MGCLPSALFWCCRAGGLGAAEGFEAEEQADAEDEAEPVKALQADGRLRGVQPGDIILMHDLYGTSADAAVVLIPELKKRGYQLVTVSEMASLRGGMTPGQVYHSFRP